jgi:hypothetical protein
MPVHVVVVGKSVLIYVRCARTYGALQRRKLLFAHQRPRQKITFLQRARRADGCMEFWLTVRC